MSFVNNVKVTLNASINSSATSVQLVKAITPYNDPPTAGKLTIMDSLSSPTKIEIITYTGRTDNSTYWTLTGVTRGEESSTASAFSVGDSVVQSWTASSATASVAAAGTADFVASGTLPNGKPVVLKADGTVEVVALTTTYLPSPSAKSPTTFNSGGTDWTVVTMLSAEKAIVAYKYNGTINACVLSISGSTITAGTPISFGGNPYHISVEILTPSKAIVVWKDNNNSNFGTSCILDVSGTTINAGTPVVFESANSDYNVVSALTETKALVAYKDSGNLGYGTSRVLDVSGSTITVGAPVVFESDTTNYISLTMLTSSKSLVTYQDDGNSGYGTSCVLDISGTTINAGTPTVFESRDSNYISVTSLTTTKAIVCFNSLFGRGYSCVLDISGTTITAGGVVRFHASGADYISVTTLNETKALVVYKNGNTGVSCFLDVSGSTITAGTPVVFISDNVYKTFAASLTSSKVVVVYYNASDSYYGIARIIDTASYTANLTTTNFLGTSTAAYTNGQTATVMLEGGLSTNQTGLTAGTGYYVQEDGTLATTADSISVFAGKALSTTSLQLDGPEAEPAAVVAVSGTADFVASGTLPNGKPVVLKADGTIEVVSGASGSEGVGTAVPYSTHDTYYSQVAMLTSTKGIVVYSSASLYYGTACVLDVSGTTITVGNPTDFTSASASDMSVKMLTSTTAIVTYKDGGNSSYGTACILSVSGTTITVGTPVVYESAAASKNIVAHLSPTKAIVVYQDGGNSQYGTSCILDISGTTITAGTPVVFHSVGIANPYVEALSSTKAVVVYQGAASGYYGTSCILDVSGSTITAGTPVVYESANAGYSTAAALTSTKAIVTYRDGGNSYYGTSCILDISGTTITAGTPAVFESAHAKYISVAMITATKAKVIYADGGNLDYGTYCILDVSGSTITAGTPVVFESAGISYTGIATLPNAQMVVFRDAGNSGYGTSIVLQDAYNSSNLTSTNFVGTSQAAYTNGQTASVMLQGGVSANQSGLTIGSTYYVQGDGTFATSAGTPSVAAGKALSATSILLKGI